MKLDMQFIIPGWDKFVNRFEDNEDHPDVKQWNEPDYIPTSYVEAGIRHIVVFDLDEPIRYTYDPTEGLKQVKEIF